MVARDFYAVLGVRQDASPDQIRKAYLRLAKKLHPDLNRTKDANERFLAVKEAYEVLSSPLLRREYDERPRVPVGSWDDLSRRQAPSRTVRASVPYAVREPRGVRVRTTAEDRRRRQLQFAYTAVTASLSVVFLGGSFLLVALGGVVPGVLAFAMGLILVLLLLHLFPMVHQR